MKTDQEVRCTCLDQVQTDTDLKIKVLLAIYLLTDRILKHFISDLKLNARKCAFKPTYRMSLNRYIRH